VKTTSNSAILTGKQNGITVVDVDYCRQFNKDLMNPFTESEMKANIDNHVFTKALGQPSEIQKECDTLTVESKSGGYHYYFKYEQELKSKAYDELQVDIQNNGKLIYAPLTFAKGYPNPYRIVNATSIKEMPKKMKDFLLKLQCSSVKETAYSLQIKGKKVKKMEQVDNEVKRLKCYMTKSEFSKVCSQLPIETFVDTTSWKDFTMFCKAVDKPYAKIMWNEYSQKAKNYNKENNDYWWSLFTHNCSYTGVMNTFLKAKMPNGFDYFFAKPVDDVMRKSDKVFDKERLFVSMNEDDTLGDAFKEKRGLIVKAGMGLGKTQAFIAHIPNLLKTRFKGVVKDSNTNKQFIVLTSRVSMAQDIYNRIIAEGIDCEWYQNADAIKDGLSMVCQVESIAKLSNIKDWSKYTIMIDEIDSFVKHIHTSPTCSRIRRDIFAQLREICKKANVFGCDADVSSRSLKWFEHMMGESNVNYYEFERQFFSGKKTREHFSETTFVNQIMKEDKWLLMMDSKAKAGVVRQELTEMKKVIDPNEQMNIVVIDSDFNGEMTLDEYDKVICSPSVVYGIDSHMERKVFAYYRSHTISPQAMVQQIGRERDITELHYLFVKKECRSPQYETLLNARAVIEDRWALNKHELPEDILSWKFERDTEENFYYELLAEYMFVDSAYNTNKFVHFRDLLRRKGFVIEENKYNKTTVNSKKRDKVLKEMDKEDKLNRLEAFVLQKEEKSRRSMNIPNDRLQDFADIYIEPFAMTEHFNYCKLLFSSTENVTARYLKINDYDGKKAQSGQGEIVFLKELADTLACDRHFNPTKSFDSDVQRNEMYNNYLIAFNKNEKKFGKKKNEAYDSDWTKDSDLTRDIGKALKDLVGKKNIESKRGGGGKDAKATRKNVHTIINEDYHMELMGYRREPSSKNLFDDDVE
jgi:hypothetical protein